MRYPDLDTVMQEAAAAPTPSGGGVSYDGASKLDGLSLWQPPLRSADMDMLPEKASLDARSRDILRNDAYAASGSAIHKDSIVGEEYRLNAKLSSRLLFGKEDSVWEDEANEEIETRFRLYAESSSNWADRQGVNTLTGLVRLAIGTHLSGGEVLATAEWTDDGRPYASNMLMIDADRLQSPISASIADWKIRNGVERDKGGRPIAYHIRNGHPTDPAYIANRLGDTRRVRRATPWGRPLVLHIYETLRPDQSRGLAAMVTALGEMRMLKHFRRSELERAVIAASYAMSIESDFPPEAAALMGGGNADANPYVDGMGEMMQMQAEYMKHADNIHMTGAKIPVLPPNTKLHIQNPGAESPAGSNFEASSLRHIAAALNLSYEEVSRDYTKTNYSSGRLAEGKSLQGMRPRKRLVADGTANFIYRLWLEEAVNYNDLECFKRRNMPSFYDAQNADIYTRCEWIGAGQALIDPLKETQADILSIKSGLMTQESAVTKRGGDWRLVKKQQKRERELDKSLGNPSLYDNVGSSDMQNALGATPREPAEE